MAWPRELALARWPSNRSPRDAFQVLASAEKWKGVPKAALSALASIGIETAGDISFLLARLLIALRLVAVPTRLG